MIRKQAVHRHCIWFPSVSSPNSFRCVGCVAGCARVAETMRVALFPIILTRSWLSHAEGPRDALCQLKSCHLLHSCMKNCSLKGHQEVHDHESHPRSSKVTQLNRTYITSFQCSNSLALTVTMSLSSAISDIRRSRDLNTPL